MCVTYVYNMCVYMVTCMYKLHICALDSKTYGI